MSLLTDLTGSGTDAALSGINAPAGYLDKVAGWGQAGAGGYATESTASLQPAYLPYSGTGYLHLSGDSGNYASLPSSSNLNGLTTLTIQADGMKLNSWRGWQEILTKRNSAGGQIGWSLTLEDTGKLRLAVSLDGASSLSVASTEPVPDTGAEGLQVKRSGASVAFYTNDGGGFVQLGETVGLAGGATANVTSQVEVGSKHNGTSDVMFGKVERVRLWDNTDTAVPPLLDINFNNGNHRGDTFTCPTGQIVTIHTSGSDPALLVKRSVVRFDGDDDVMQGFLNSPVSEFRAILVFTALGDGGEANGRVIGLNSTGGLDEDADGSVIARNVLGSINSYLSQNNLDGGLFSDRILYELDALDGNQRAARNGVEESTGAFDLSAVNTEEFSLGAATDGSATAAIDLEAIYLFPGDTDDESFQKAVSYFNKLYSVY